MTRKPSSVRAVRFPAAYGAPGGPVSLLPWSYVEERVRVASNYWITTVGPNARPHARPVDGVWIDGALCFGGSPETRWGRNLMANPSISVHLSSEAEAIILEGTAEYVTDPSHSLERWTEIDRFAIMVRTHRRSQIGRAHVRTPVTV